MMGGVDVVGTDCVPPPGGRDEEVLRIGKAPPTLMNINGEAVGGGRIKREKVVLEGGAVYEGTWKVRGLFYFLSLSF